MGAWLPWSEVIALARPFGFSEHQCRLCAEFWRSVDALEVDPPCSDVAAVDTEHGIARLRLVFHRDIIASCFPGVSRDYVSHGTRNGGPFFTAASPVQGALAGTQALDGWWSQAKQNCQGVGAGDDEQIAMRVHESQWRHWFGEADKFVAAGTVLNGSSNKMTEKVSVFVAASFIG